jgi:hypothetical protein
MPFTSGAELNYLFASPVSLTSGVSYVVSFQLARGSDWWSGYPTTYIGDSTYTAGGPGLYHVGLDTFPTLASDGYFCVQPILCTSSSVTPPQPPSSSPSQPTTIIVAPTLSCGTTADLCTAVRQLDQRLSKIMELVTLTQRYSVPFAYVPGAVHSGLTGTGSFAISGLLGLRVQLASTDSDEPILPGNPPYLWNQGWLSVNDSNGLLEEKRLTRTGMEWFPRFCQTATSFNWDVGPGVTMVVTELQAET